MVSSGNGRGFVGGDGRVCVVRKGVLRRAVQDEAVHVPLDSWSREVEGLGVSKVDLPGRRSGVDSVGRGAAGSGSPWPSMGPISLLALLRFRP